MVDGVRRMGYFMQSNLCPEASIAKAYTHSSGDPDLSSTSKNWTFGSINISPRLQNLNNHESFLSRFESRRVTSELANVWSDLVFEALYVSLLNEDDRTDW